MSRILPTIVISQFFCTSLWFAGNAILPELITSLNLSQGFLTHALSAVQLGFIVGTLVFAIFTVADRFSATKVFFCCSIIAALFNLGFCFNNPTEFSILLFRFLTGVFLAGIYPVGMKIASDHFQKGLGRSLGYLVGALVLGTALPYLIKGLALDFNWKYIMFATSFLSVLGGSLMLFLVPDGPFKNINQGLKFSTFLTGFSDKNFRSAAFGYFGHMWELYAFWAFVPIVVSHFASVKSIVYINADLTTFLIIATGSIACVFSGRLSYKFGTKNVAVIALTLSCLCCLLSPFIINTNSFVFLIVFLTFWAFVVIADSPLFSTLVAQNAPADSKGTSLTIVNCLGFFVTILSMETINQLLKYVNFQYIYMVLALGPIIGLLTIFNNRK
jgi:MFS family permease